MRVLCVKFSKMVWLGDAGAPAAQLPHSGAPGAPGRRQAAKALGASFLRSRKRSILRQRVASSQSSWVSTAKAGVRRRRLAGMRAFRVLAGA